MIRLALETLRERLSLVLLFATSGFAWLALWQWGASPNGPHLHHAHLHLSGQRGLVSEGFVFVAGWTVMSVAMMLPTSAPLVNLFQRFVRTRPNRLALIVTLSAGYMAIWILVGVAAFGLVIALRELARLALEPASSGWMLASGALMLAGAYQFSSLKYRCLDRCRSPLSFLVEHWTGHRPHRDALTLGLRHGLFCAGCCWALMLLMLPFGAGNLGWMLSLGGIMALEKNVSWGRRISKPIGIVLLALAVVNVLWRPGFLPSL